MSNITDADYQLLLDEIVTEFPDFEVKKKSESTLMKAIDIFLRIVSFNQMDSFKRFTTTLGTTVYVSDAWDTRPVASRWITMSHERVHMEQAREYGRVWFSFLYLFVLPVLFAFYRTKFEKEAYEVSLHAILLAHGPAAVLRPALKENMVKHFTSSQYLWMWVKKGDIEEWYDAAVIRVLDKEGYDAEGN